MTSRLSVSPYLRYGIIENIDTVRHIPHGSFWGVKLSTTPITWTGALVFFALRLLFSLIAPGLSLTERFTDALLFAIAVEVTNPLHAFGHILSGKLVHSPMDELLLTATRDVNLYYGDQSAVPSHVHLGRALGGPVFNLLVAGLIYACLPSVPVGPVHVIVDRIAAMNLLFGVGGFLPLPSLDGEVIWRELLRPLRDAWRGQV